MDDRVCSATAQKNIFGGLLVPPSSNWHTMLCREENFSAVSFERLNFRFNVVSVLFGFKNADEEKNRHNKPLFSKFYHILESLKIRGFDRSIFGDKIPRSIKILNLTGVKNNLCL